MGASKTCVSTKPYLKAKTFCLVLILPIKHLDFNAFVERVVHVLAILDQQLEIGKDLLASGRVVYIDAFYKVVDATFEQSPYSALHYCTL